MTREDLISFGQKKYGDQWIARLAADLNYSISSVLRVANGITPKVSRRMELELKQLIRKQQFETLARQDVRQ